MRGFAARSAHLIIAICMSPLLPPPPPRSEMKAKHAKHYHGRIYNRAPQSGTKNDIYPHSTLGIDSGSDLWSIARFPLRATLYQMFQYVAIALLFRSIGSLCKRFSWAEEKERREGKVAEQTESLRPTKSNSLHILFMLGQRPLLRPISKWRVL